MGKVAIITGANQGLGFGLVEQLNAIYKAGDFIYLAVRRVAKGQEAIDSIIDKKAHFEAVFMDVSKEESVQAVMEYMAAKHGTVDLVISNAAQRMDKETPYRLQVAEFIQTNNMGAYHVLKHFQPLLTKKGRLIVIASGFGTLTHLTPKLHPLFATTERSMIDINRVMHDYVEEVKAGTDALKGWPKWINIPSKIGQVALVRIAAQKKKDAQAILAVCPGLVNTAASRPFFENMKHAQSPFQAAKSIIDLIDRSPDEINGKLMKFGEEISWQ